MTSTKNIPWRKRHIIPQLIALLITFTYASIALFFLHWAFLIGYISLWLLFIVLNQRFVCRDCKYWGSFCGSFGLGLLKLFKPSGKEEFNHKKAKKCILVFLAASIYPLVLLLFLPPHWIWPLIYLVLGVFCFLLHYKLGCANCDLTHCSGNPRHKKVAVE